MSQKIVDVLHMYMERKLNSIELKSPWSLSTWIGCILSLLIAIVTISRGLYPLSANQLTILILPNGQAAILCHSFRVIHGIHLYHWAKFLIQFPFPNGNCYTHIFSVRFNIFQCAKANFFPKPTSAYDLNSARISSNTLQFLNCSFRPVRLINVSNCPFSLVFILLATCHPTLDQFWTITKRRSNISGIDGPKFDAVRSVMVALCICQLIR